MVDIPQCMVAITKPGCYKFSRKNAIKANWSHIQFVANKQINISTVKLQVQQILMP